MADTLPATCRLTRPAIGCVVPAFNEADNLPELLRAMARRAVGSEAGRGAIAARTAQDPAMALATPPLAQAKV